MIGITNETFTNKQIAKEYQFNIDRTKKNLEKRKQTLKDILNPNIETAKWKTKERFEKLIVESTKDYKRKLRFIKKYL